MLSALQLKCITKAAFGGSMASSDCQLQRPPPLAICSRRMLRPSQQKLDYVNVTLLSCIHQSLAILAVCSRRMLWPS